MDEDKFEIDGITYIAKDEYPQHRDYNCLGCAFRRVDECQKAPPCGKLAREDKRNVIFIKETQ
ncbi:MAG: hypothetical protein ACRCUS_00945 [Anaerovoracaceae bacterium]